MTKMRLLSVTGRIYLGLVLFFLYAPIAVMALMSFNSSEFYQLPIDLTTKWYIDLWNNDEILANRDRYRPRRKRSA